MNYYVTFAFYDCSGEAHFSAVVIACERFRVTEVTEQLRIARKLDRLVVLSWKRIDAAEVERWRVYAVKMEGEDIPVLTLVPQPHTPSYEGL